MSFLDQAHLAQDSVFAERLGAGLTKEAKPKGSTDLAALVMRSPAEGARVFMPFIASSPTFDTMYAEGGQEAITDGDLLAAMQANWDLVEAVYFPPTEEPV
jgi:hypothetical protein